MSFLAGVRTTRDRQFIRRTVPNLPLPLLNQHIWLVCPSCLLPYFPIYASYTPVRPRTEMHAHTHSITAPVAATVPGRACDLTAVDVTGRGRPCDRLPGGSLWWQLGCASTNRRQLAEHVGIYLDHSRRKLQLQLCIIHMDVDNTRLTPPPLAAPATTTTQMTPSKIAGTSPHSEFREGSGYAHTSPMAVLDPYSPTLHVRT